MTPANQKAFCLTFVKAKLEQKALECLPDEVRTVKDIVDGKIKHKGSDVIEGKMVALRLKKGNYTDFTKEANELADAYRRALVLEGITKTKADQLTIKKMIEICRKNTYVEGVRSTIQSTKYELPSEVLSTFVTQCDIANREKRESEITRQRQNKSENFRGIYKFGQRGGFNRHQNRDDRGQQNGRGRYQNNRGNGHYRGGGNGNFRCFQRGNYAPQRNKQTIRLVAASPQPTQAVGQNTVNDSLSEQFFRLST